MAGRWAAFVGGLGLTTGSLVRFDEPMARRTTLRVGGPADVLVEPRDEADLAKVVAGCSRAGVSLTVVGRGSNLLIRDGGIRGVVVSLTQPAFGVIEVRGTRLHCGAGVRLNAVSIEARRNGFSGLEFLEGIPGSVGGALRMNAGAMGSATFEVVQSVRLMERDGMVREVPASEMAPRYRSCPLLRERIALGAVLVGNPGISEAVRERMEAYSRKRWESQPTQPSAGCIFKNPTVAPAGKLVDELGLKGLRVGAAAVSAIHGNFIVNEGGATATDVLTLIEKVRSLVFEARQVALETEVEILGEDVFSGGAA